MRGEQQHIRVCLCVKIRWPLHDGPKFMTCTTTAAPKHIHNAHSHCIFTSSTEYRGGHHHFMDCSYCQQDTHLTTNKYAAHPGQCTFPIWRIVAGSASVNDKNERKEGAREWWRSSICKVIIFLLHPIGAAALIDCCSLAILSFIFCSFICMCEDAVGLTGQILHIIPDHAYIRRNAG